MKVSAQLDALAAVPHGILPGSQRIGGSIGPRVSLDAVEKRRVFRHRKSNTSLNPYPVPILTELDQSALLLTFKLHQTFNITESPS
jgi:hypothetical protein